MPNIGFSPRKQSMTLYSMPGFDKYEDTLIDSVSTGLARLAFM